MRVYPLAISVLVAAATAATSSAFVVPSAPLLGVRHRHHHLLMSDGTEGGDSPRVAYDEWRAEYGKGDFDAARFEVFKANLDALTAANEASLQRASDTGVSDPPKLLELNEYADMTAEEYKAAMAGASAAGEPAAEPAPSMDLLGKAKEAFGMQSEASTALEEANAALAEEEEKLAQELGLESVEELEDALDSLAGIASDGGELDSSNISREARVRSAYLDWCRDNGKEPDESRFPAFEANYLTMETYSNESGRELVLNKYADCTEEEYAAILKADADAAEEQKAQEAAAKEEAAAAAKAAKEAEAAARAEELAAAKAARQAELKKIAAEAEAAKKAREAEMAAKREEDEEARAAREKERKERQAAQEKLAAQRAQEAEAAAIAAARDEAEKDAAREARMAALRQQEADETLRQARERQAKIATLQSPRKATSQGGLFGLFTLGGKAQKAPKSKPAAPTKPKKSEGLFSFFAPAKPSVTQTLKSAPRKTPAKSSSPPDFFAIFGQSSVVTKTKSTPKARETSAAAGTKTSAGGLFSFLSGSGSQPTSTRTLIPASRKGAKKAAAPRKVAPAVKKASPVAKKAAPPPKKAKKAAPAKKKKAPVAKKAAPVAAKPEKAPAAPLFSFFKQEQAAPKVTPAKQAPKKAAAAKKTPPPKKAVKRSGTLTAPETPKEKKPAFSFFGGGKKAAPAPEVPVLKNFVQNKDGSITGKISNSKQFRSGTTITTSPIRGKAKRGSFVQTTSGSRYKLE